MKNQAFIRNLNERRLLTLLRVEQRMTRADIARSLDLTRSTVTSLVDGLKDLDLVSEIGVAEPDKTMRQDIGRPGIDIALCPAGGYFVGVEIGVGMLRLVLMDMTLQLVTQSAVSILKTSTAAAVITRIGAFLTKCRRMIDHPDRIRTVSVTVPGLVSREGLILHLPIVGWKNVNFLKPATERLGLPVMIENNANAAAFGEVYCHPKASADLIAFLKLGNGCGGAAILNGRLMRGASGSAAEFGHIHVLPDGPLCSCGRRGCLEPLVNLDALERYLRDAGSDIEAMPETVAAALPHDPKVQKAMEAYGRALALGLVTLTNIFNPSDIVLGGAMRPLIESLLARLREGVKAGIVPGMLVPSIDLSRNGPFECAIGAAALAHQRAYDEVMAGLV